MSEGENNILNHLFLNRLVTRLASHYSKILSNRPAHYFLLSFSFTETIYLSKLETEHFVKKIMLYLSFQSCPNAAMNFSLLYLYVITLIPFYVHI